MEYHNKYYFTDIRSRGLKGGTASNHKACTRSSTDYIDIIPKTDIVNIPMRDRPTHLIILLNGSVFGSKTKLVVRDDISSIRFNIDSGLIGLFDRTLAGSLSGIGIILKVDNLQQSGLFPNRKLNITVSQGR